MKIKKTVTVNNISQHDISQTKDEVIQLIAGEEVKVLLTQERYQELLDFESRAKAKPKTPEQEVSEMIMTKGKELYRVFKPQVDNIFKDITDSLQSEIKKHSTTPSASSTNDSSDESIIKDTKKKPSPDTMAKTDSSKKAKTSSSKRNS